MSTTASTISILLVFALAATPVLIQYDNKYSDKFIPCYDTCCT